ncbi:hypothetical protein HDU92_008449 [Lobulomyces angularis]|nr:hypothetical protein HDU92_008449 [Lobulomyces angularis]
MNDLVTFPSVELKNYADLLWSEELFLEIIGPNVDETEYKCKKNQTFIKRLMQNSNDMMNILLFHSMGAGKTDCSIIAYDNLKSIYPKVVYIIKGPANQIAIEENIRKWLIRYKNINSEQDIKDYFTNNIIFERFITFSKKIELRIEEVVEKYNGYLFIVDEAHDLRIKPEASIEDQKKVYRVLKDFLRKLDKSRLIMMTGTPMYDKSTELQPLLILLSSLNSNNYDNDLNVMKKNNISFCSKIENVPRYRYVESVEGTKLKNSGLIKSKLYILQMMGEQREAYNRVVSTMSGEVKKKTNFMRKPQSVTLATIPDSKIVETVDKVDKINIELYNSDGNNIYKFNKTYERIHANILDKIQNYSVKLFHMKDELAKIGNSYIFCELVGGMGINYYVSMLQLMGYQVANNISCTEIKNNTNTKKILVLTSESSNIDLNQINDKLKLFNHVDNIDGKYIKIIIGSNITTQALTFNNVRRIFILTPHWNLMKIDQAVKRVIRLNSHSDELKNCIVDIYKYAAISTPIDDIIANNEITGVDSIDLMKYKISENKIDNIKLIEDDLRKIAIDYKLYNSDVSDILTDKYYATSQKSLYINYQRINLKHILIEKVYNLYKNFKENNKNLSIKNILEHINIDRTVALVILYDYTNRLKFISLDNNIYLLRNINQYYYFVEYRNTQNKHKIKFIKFIPLSIDRKIKRLTMFENCIVKSDYIKIIKEKNNNINVSLILKDAIKYKHENILSFFKNMYVLYDNTYYNCSDHILSSNSNYNNNMLLSDKIYKNTITYFDNNNWVNAKSDTEKIIIEKLMEKINIDKQRCSDPLIEIYIIYKNCEIYIRDKHNDKYIGVDNRKVSRGRNIDKYSINQSNSYFSTNEECLLYILLCYIGIDILDNYAKNFSNKYVIANYSTKEILLYINKYKIIYHINGKKIKDKKKKSTCETEYIDFYKEGFKLLCYFMNLKDGSLIKNKISLVSDVIIYSGKYYLR